MGQSARAAQEVVRVRRSIWRLRARREAPRVALLCLAAWGLFANARFALDPPAPKVYRINARPTVDRPAEWLATAFARAYLTFSGANPQAYGEALAAYLGGEGEGEGSLSPSIPPTAQQQVVFAQPVAEQEGPAGSRLYTIACQTAAGALLYLTVAVRTEKDGSLVVVGYPAFVGPPRLGAWQQPEERFEAVEEPALSGVVSLALRNYLSDQGNELTAELSEGAVVSLPPQPLTLETVHSLHWVPGLSSVVAVVAARDQAGVRYTLAYQMDVKKVAGRWEVAAIQVNPLSQ